MKPITELTQFEKRAAIAMHREFCTKGKTAPSHCYACQCLAGDCPCHGTTKKVTNEPG